MQNSGLMKYLSVQKLKFDRMRNLRVFHCCLYFIYLDNDKFCNFN